MKIRPLHDRVIVKRLDEEKKSAGGIVIPDTAAEKPSQGEVVHVGPGKLDDSGKVVGVITETDIFKAFVEMLGGGEHGLRLTVQVPTGSGTLAKLAGKITELGGLILSVGSMDRETDGAREIVVKVKGVTKDTLITALESIGDHVVDAREV